MVNSKVEVKEKFSINWNEQMLSAMSVAKKHAIPGRDLHVELCAKGLAIVKSGIWCGVTNGKNMVLDIKFDSIVVLENGWMVACKYGIYNLYDENGKMYKGISFLKKSNAIRFAKTL